MITDLDPLVLAAKSKKQVTLEYTKQNGEFVQHTGGIYEIGVNKTGSSVIWLWDTTMNDHIRQFLIGNINSFQVLDTDFTDNQYPIKINGEIVG